MCVLSRDMIVQCRTDMPAHALLNCRCHFAEPRECSTQTCWVTQADLLGAHISPHTREYFPCPGATADQRRAKKQSRICKESRGPQRGLQVDR